MSAEIKQGKQVTDLEYKAISETKKGKGVDPEGAEVQGQGYFRVHCWNCGTVNVAPEQWDGFVCFRCGAINSKW